MAESVLKSTPLIANKKPDLKKCIICQGLKKNNEVKLGSTPEGIQQIKDACRDLDDAILDGLTEEEIVTIKYHRQNYHFYTQYYRRTLKINMSALQTRSRNTRRELLSKIQRVRF